MAIELDITVPQKVRAKIISISAKCSDLCSSELTDDQDATICEQADGYVPGWFPDGGGDYVVLDIDLETGQILNWSKPTAKQLQDWISEVKGEDRD